MPCEFFNKLPINPPDEAIEKELIKSVFEAMQAALPALKLQAQNAVLQYGGDVPDAAIEELFRSHVLELENRLEQLFEGESNILSRVSSARKDPSLLDLPDAKMDEFYHAGTTFALFWYGVTGSPANPTICLSINHAHADSIDRALQNITEDEPPKAAPQPVAQSKSCLASSWPYWLLMLIIGVVVGIIISAMK